MDHAGTSRLNSTAHSVCVVHAHQQEQPRDDVGRRRIAHASFRRVALCRLRRVACQSPSSPLESASPLTLQERRDHAERAAVAVTERPVRAQDPRRVRCAHSLLLLCVCKRHSIQSLTKTLDRCVCMCVRLAASRTCRSSQRALAPVEVLARRRQPQSQSLMLSSKKIQSTQTLAHCARRRSSARTSA